MSIHSEKIFFKNNKKTNRMYKTSKFILNMLYFILKIFRWDVNDDCVGCTRDYL